ncbi:MAG: cytidylate kinase-like family protein [Eubacteriales bacterium]|nr:cytidylate kinase-like family protein [Eubacteriales bacterium]
MSRRVITINRMYGSGGRMIGKALAEELGIRFYDKELIEIASKEKGIPFDELMKVDERKANQWHFPVDHQVQIDSQYRFIPMNDVLYDVQKNIILDLVQKEDCVIVGRCANHILKDKSLSLFIYAPFEKRVQTVMERTGREEKSARRTVKKLDKERRAYYEYFTDEYWMDLLNYDLSIDSSRFTKEQILKMIKAAL